jgi:predicted alpha/beta-fold hydrolase
MTVTGTHNLSDWGTDIYLAAGKLKSTNRYKEADNILKKAKQKYHPKETILAAHSLGATISGYIASKEDRVITLDKGATAFQPIRNNETHYRTSGDIVSLLNANSKHTVNLKNENIKTGILPIDTYNAHNVDNIKGKPIFI